MAQVYAVKQVCSNQYQAMVALVKLKSYGITDDHILNLNNYFERNVTNNKSIQNL
jgi:hypothetical protein